MVQHRKHGSPDSFGGEPTPDGDEWQEHGGQLLWVAGTTSGGAPYGLTVEEFRRANEQGAAGAGWALAKHILRDLLEMWCGPPTRAEVGFVKKIGEGLSRDVFAAEATLAPDPHGRSGGFVVLLPRADADPELDARTRKELRLLGRLELLALPFRVPTAVGAYPAAGHCVLVRRFVPGIPLDLRAGRMRARPWETIGPIASAIHALAAGAFEDLLPGYRTRREHAEASLAVLDRLPAQEARSARAWAEAHLPPAEPSVVLHGDLLGQNLLVGGDDPPAVIDWEYAQRGDPAYDLAIVTRGVKQPFQIEGGLQRLLEAYHAHGDHPVVRREEVRLHELCLLAGWYVAALADGGGSHGPAQELGRLRGLLDRAQRGS